MDNMDDIIFGWWKNDDGTLFGNGTLMVYYGTWMGLYIMELIYIYVYIHILGLYGWWKTMMKNGDLIW